MITIQNHLLDNINSFISTDLKTVLITDERVACLHGCKLKQLQALQITIPSGEEFKTRSTKETIENQMLAEGYGRDTLIIALGGGVVCDIAGFVAATYCRGVPLILIPSTLLAMADACIGGKTAVNVLQGKNLIGAFHLPEHILIDPTLLNTLPLSELKQGIVEIIKHGLIADKHFFHFLEENAQAILALEPIPLEKVIRESCRIKKEIVSQDQREKNIRSLLNFGHTVGHALEQVFNYQIAHGTAVAMGMILESYLSFKLKLLSQSSYTRILAILNRYAIPVLEWNFSFRQLEEAMRMDKKALKGHPRFVLLEDIGKPNACENQFCFSVDLMLVERAFEEIRHAVCCN